MGWQLVWQVLTQWDFKEDDKLILKIQIYNRKPFSLLPVLLVRVLEY